jgi:pimeloyl-ACP methyl ester carboxylesterase
MLFYTRYRRELGAARRRVQSSGSSITETRLGAIEQVTFGEGPPVLLVHGVVGGADQGRGLVGAYFGDGFKVVAVSRFGYGGSPLHTDSSPRAQADRYAALLDVLGIGKVAVVGTSAGTASCLQFALRHKDRCSALVLFSMAVPPYGIPPTPVQRLVRAYCRSEFLFWVMFQLPSIRNRLLGEPSDIVNHASAADCQMLAQLTESFLPGTLRADGIINDMAVSNPDLNRGYPFAEITVPALIFHAKDDRWGAFAMAQEAAERIPGVQFRALESGGHLLLGSRQAVGAEIAQFVRARTSHSVCKGGGWCLTNSISGEGVFEAPVG